MRNEGKVSYTMNTKEEPVLTYNDFAFIAERNSIVFRAGDSPIWNRNETILPMSWRLFQNTIVNPGKKYSLATVPTTSTAMDFDIRKNQPDFVAMLDKRMKQSMYVEKAQETYRRAYGYEDGDDYKIEQLDQDVYSDEIMDIVNLYCEMDKTKTEYEDDNSVDEDEEESSGDSMIDRSKLEDNEEQFREIEKAKREYAVQTKKRYAGNNLGMDDLVSFGIPNHQYDLDIIRAFKDVKGKMEQDKEYFCMRNGNLCGADGTPYIVRENNTEALNAINEAAKDKKSRVYAEDTIQSEKIDASYTVTDAFYLFLVSMNSWKFANGAFEQRMKEIMNEG